MQRPKSRRKEYTGTLSILTRELVMLVVPTPGMEAVTRDMAPIPGNLKYPVPVFLFTECQDKGASFTACFQ